MNIWIQIAFLANVSKIQEVAYQNKEWSEPLNS